MVLDAGRPGLLHDAAAGSLAARFAFDDHQLYVRTHGLADKHPKRIARLNALLFMELEN